MMVRVTVESPRGRLTLSAPDDVPVERLIPALVEACRCENDGTRWSLRARGEPALAPHLTLAQSGLYQGAVLELSPEDPPTRQGGLASWREVAGVQARLALARLRAAAGRAASERR
jgi:WXG100 protein secretion system (Wss), protein YukD